MYGLAQSIWVEKQVFAAAAVAAAAVGVNVDAVVET